MDKTISGRNGAKLTCRYCSKRSYVEKNWWKKVIRRKGGGMKYTPGTQKLCHVCSSPDHIMVNCPKNINKKTSTSPCAFAEYNVKRSMTKDSTLIRSGHLRS